MKNKGFFVIPALGILLVLASIIFYEVNRRNLAQVAERAERNLEAKLTGCRNALELPQITSSRQQFSESYYLFRKQQIGVYRYENNRLVYWNNSSVPMDKDPSRLGGEQGVVQLENGLYLYARKGPATSMSVAICLIKPDYELQNRYLANDFEKWTGIPAEVNLDLTHSLGPQVKLQGKPVFAIYGFEKNYTSSSLPDLCFLLFISGICLVLLSILKVARDGISQARAALILGLVISVRLLLIVLKWPAFFSKSFLYDVRLYGNANSFLNGYLGDILLNSVFILFVACFLFFTITRIRSAAIAILVLSMFILLCVYQFNSSVISLVSDSTLNFDLLNIFNIGMPVFIAITALSLTALALFAAVRRISLYFLSGGIRKDIILFSIFILISCTLKLLDQDLSFFECSWPLILAAGIFIGSKFPQKGLALLVGVQVIIISAVMSAILNDHIEQNQSKDLAVLSLKLGERQDPVLENEFSGIAAKISSDENLRNLIMILPTTSDAIIELLNQKYFNDYFKRYQVEVSLFDKDCHPLLAAKNPVLLNEGFFEDQIKVHSDSTFTKGLYFNKDYRKNSRYIARIKLDDHHLYVLLQPKQFEELGSLPDLLLDQTQQKHEKLKNFSYAVYRSGQNTSSYGNFNYPIYLPDPASLASSSTEHVHYYHEPDESTVVIITRALKTWGYFFTFNSYMLLFYSLVTYSAFFLYSLVFTDRFTSASLTRRIQVIVILLLFVAMSAVGITSATLVSRQFQSENKEQLREKTTIIINELSQFKTEMLFEEGQKEAVNLRLTDYARLFNTDISLFTRDGFLFTTSQPRLYGLGLAAPFANPRALWQLRNNLSSAVSITERAGSLDYLSVYTPLFDTDRRIAGYINLPYFARQNDLVNELSGIISALVNVYVILFVISIVAGLILAGYITQPLRLIQQQISNISLGKKNEKIIWQSNDEIGRLILEYNQMLVKLEESANLLAQSERESAWREMARQVAHEIKNPLTPMKLNLQYLQHLMKSDPVDFREKFEKASAGIIEQIDALATIASEFSNFAKLPEAHLKTINLGEIIGSSVQLFSNQKNIVIKNRIPEREILVKGDSEQCLRVFNNILANAVEALAEVPDPYIEIGRTFSDNKVTIVIRDNGCGISEERKSKIFTPNFTTKTTGSGLGLAMVKNIMQGFEGRIWFESEEGLGTAFYLEFVLEQLL